MIEDFYRWRQELLFTGAIVQDGDDTVSPTEAARRCNRYVELLEMVTGLEDQQVFQALVDSMSAVNDYEVYQSTMGAAFRFPRERFGAWLFDALREGFLRRDPARAGDWLGQLAFLGAESTAVATFNKRWKVESDSTFTSGLLKFVVENETDGWLRSPEQIGLLRPTRDE